MSPTFPSQKMDRQVRRDIPNHRFAIGQQVRLRGGFARPVMPASIYRITGKLPPHGGLLQYRIRNDDERHERVVTEDNLSPLAVPTAGDAATPIERNFGNAQGTETQQSRSQKAETGKGSFHS